MPAGLSAAVACACDRAPRDGADGRRGRALVAPSRYRGPNGGYAVEGWRLGRRDLHVGLLFYLARSTRLALRPRRPWCADTPRLVGETGLRKRPSGAS